MIELVENALDSAESISDLPVVEIIIEEIGRSKFNSMIGLADHERSLQFISEQFCFYLNTKRLMLRRLMYLGRRGAKNFIGGTPAVETFDQLQQRIPERIIEHVVHGMLPKGRLGKQLFTHLKVYKSPEHPHEAQKPVE
ncbi:uncharacterized protein LOC125877452 [Solanum stenotomum]|uniref:uncharacterized protein LOC125877452 n=1 Tax=Solanum stenotomum TaxID=172797 RepID=UPI0020D15917|nr:uncharacterized protein LOC125877452 [Solanum stenotomum]